MCIFKMYKLWCVILFTTTPWLLTTGSKLETIKKCCALGTNYGNSGLKCSTFQPPVAGVAKEDESLCLNSVDVCCKQVYRDKQCKLGQTDATSTSECATLSNDLDGFRKDCCEACKLGLEAGSVGQSCSSDFGLGDLMVSAYKACCNNKISTSTVSPTPNITLSTTVLTTTSAITTTEEYPISSEKYDINNPPPPPSLEELCDIPDLCAHLCIPTQDSYKCDCYAGYTLMADGISCKPSKIPSPNLQRCETHNPCDHNCIDTGVAIKCTCQNGYKLDDDKKTCLDINECELEIDDCDDFTVCVNQIGDYDCVKENDSSDSEENKKNCPLGYAYDRDQMLCNDIDECKIGKKCPKPNICINTIGSYTCSDVTPTPKCPPGFYFKASILSCSDVDECVNGKNDCNRESQICLNTIGNYTCIDKASKKLCPPGFKKNIITQKCEDIDECEENEQPCDENEECINQPGGHNCIPKISSTLSILSTVNPLDYITLTRNRPNISINGFPVTQPNRQHFDLQPSTDKTSTLTVVQTKTTGPVHPSISSRNQPVQPPQRNTPPPQANSPLYPYNPQDHFVTCSTGYIYSDLTKTCSDIDECEQEVCDSNQNCYNTIGSYQCGCKEGFTKDYHTGACIDINECQIGSNECGEGQRCDNTIGSYVCSRTTGCGTGYTLNSASGLCEDDDECILGMHNCYELGTQFQCRNTLGSYRCERIKCIGDCYYKKYTTTTRYLPTVRETTKTYPNVYQFKQCLPGYQMNKFGVCEDIDECSSNPCKRNEKCYNLGGRHQCVPLLECRAGYELNESGTDCNDVNECSRGTHKCSGTQICKNGPGYYLCQCPPGHKLNANNDCEDINECELYRDWRCSRNARCLNTIGSYICECKEGFRENGQTCDDVNECAETPHLCHQNCVNLWGTYRCSCERGFTLNNDNRTCTDIDECEKFKNKNLCIGSCQNTPGSYMCTCPEGYRKGLDGRTCQDVDECAGDVCRNADDVCVNTRGGYKCHTIICPPNYIKDPEHKSRCKRASNVCDIRDINCIRMPGQYSYHFVTFVSNLPLPDEGRIDFFQMKGPAWISSHANFNMNVRNIRCPRHIVQADESFFRMKRDSNKVIVSLTKSIEGPQEIELELQLELYVSGAFQGKVVSTVFVYVSEYTF